MASREQALAAVYSEGKSISVQDPATQSWLELPGLLDFTESGGERDGRSAGTDSTRPTGVVSNRKAPTVECTFKYVAHPNWDVIDSAFANKTNLNFRFDTEGEVILARQTGGLEAAIAANTGAVTFELSAASAPTIDELPLGADLVIGSTHYPIVSVPDTAAGLATLASAGTGVTVKAPSAAVSSAACSIETPAERVSFSGKVLMCPTRQHSVAQQSEREGTLTIQCRSTLAQAGAVHLAIAGGLRAPGSMRGRGGPGPADCSPPDAPSPRPRTQQRI